MENEIPFEVKVIFTEAFEQYKPTILKVKSEYDYDRMPDFYHGYKESIKLYNEVKPHALHDYFPDELFRSKAPNETPQEFEYRKHLHKAMGSITRPYWEKALQEINRIWNEKNYTIAFGEVKKAGFDKVQPSEYFFDKYPTYGNIEAFFSSVVTEQKINDPNALLCIKPYREVSETEMEEPFAFIVHCADVFAFKDGEHALILSAEKSKVLFNSREVLEGLVFYYYDRDAIYKIYQAGKKTDYQFIYELYFEHNLDELPCYKLLGKPHQCETHVYYESYFGPAIPALNDALVDNSTMRISKFSHAFLQRWEYAQDCDNVDCENGYVRIGDGKGTRLCDRCKGTGKTTYLSPMSVIQVNPPNKARITEDTTDMHIPPAGYIDLNPEILKFLGEQTDANISKAFEMLNLEISLTKVKGSETALGKQIDREGLFAFLLKISKELFQLLEKTIDFMGRMRYGDAWEGVTIVYPQNFAIRTDADLTRELAEAKKNGLPDAVIKELMVSYVDTRFNNDARGKQFFSLIINADPLVTYTPAEIASFKALNIFAAWEVYLHNNIRKLVQQLAVEEGFFDRPYLEQETDLIALAKSEYQKENPGQAAQTIIERTAVDI
jgi:hypothetical protein